MPRRLASRNVGAASRLIVALDVGDLESAVALGQQLQGLVSSVKIGSALFTAVGPDAIRRLRAMGFRVFLDLKFHDIPSTVEKSCRAAVRHNVWMLTLHASGQPEMLMAAAAGAADEAARRGVPKPIIVGVTVLTSVESVDASMTRRVVALAAQAKQSGLDGVVASAQEAAAIRRRLPEPFVIVCPGIRPSAKQEADQHRVALPSQAIARGANFLVVGRPITAAANPRASAEAILREMEGG